MDLNAWEIPETVSFIVQHGFKRVALQFPDDLLFDAPVVSHHLASELKAVSDAKVYILADTSYNSSGVDEVAAQHIQADCVIHYGRASMAPLTRLPAFFVFPHQPVEAAAAATYACQHLHASPSLPSAQAVVVLLDQVLEHARQDLEQQLQQQYQGAAPLIFATPPSKQLWPSGTPKAPAAPAGCCSSNPTCCTTTHPPPQQQPQPQPQQQQQPAAPAQQASGLPWHLPATAPPLSDCLLLWLGDLGCAALQQLQLTYSAARWCCCDPLQQRWQEGIAADATRLLRRRYALVEKARDAHIIGLLVGTLAAAGYKQVLEALRAAAKAADKKTYTMLVGKPNPAKLANFPEVEIWVMVAEADGAILECRDYLAPIITPHEALLAITGQPFEAERYTLGFESVLAYQQGAAPAATSSSSAAGAAGAAGAAHLGGNIRTEEEFEELGSGGASSTAVAVSSQQQLQLLKQQAAAGKAVVVRSAAQYLAVRRSYQGLETPLTGAEAKPAELAVAGRSGRAAVYSDEPAC